MGSHEEIILDVLSRLPVKSLLRFKCVSKHWNTLISEPYFKKKHLNIHAKNQNSQKLLIGQAYDAISLYFYSTSLSSSPFQLVKDIRGLDCPLGSKPLHGRVYCCCDGLFFIGIWYKAEEKPSILLLWNPSTRDSVILPSQSEVPQEGYTYGLGYDSTSDDYKILGIDRFDEVPDEILSLKSGSSWKKIEETSGRMSNVDMSARELSLAFVHGAFHWIGWEQERSIVSFNISDEIYGEIPLPRLPYTLRRAERGVSVLEERLCVYHNNKINFDLWVMKDYAVEKSWMKWFTLPSNGASIIIPIYRFSDDEVLLSCYCSKGTAVYRTSSNRIWPLEHDNMSSITIQDGLVYTESLISPYFGYQIVS